MRLYLISVFLVYFSFSLNAQQRDWVLSLDSDQTKRLKTNTITDFEVELLSDALHAYKITFDYPILEDEVHSILNFHFSAYTVSPNYKVEKRTVIPDDALFPDQWSLEIIEASEAWNLSTGGTLKNDEEFVIAIMDDGFQIDHPDLINNIWGNPNEIPNDGIDNDGNQYVDDHKGLNIQSQNDDHNIDSHGSRVAGIIGAEGNNEIGISGINWNTKLLILSNVTNVAEIIKAYDYIYDLKRRYINSGGTDGANIVVTNFSAGIRRHFPNEFPAWCASYNLLGSVGIISVAATPNENYDLALEGDMPSLCTSPFLVMVTNTNQQDTKVFSAATSKVHVDLGAPGDNVISTNIENSYKTINGTSAATPHVSGALGLLFSVACDEMVELMSTNPSQVAIVIKQALLDGVDSIPSLKQTVSEGRLNIYKSILELGDYCGVQTSEKLELRTIGTTYSGNTSIDLSIEYATDLFSPHEVFIFDIQGRLIFNAGFDPNIYLENKISISDLNLPGGVYIITISNNKESTSRQLVISH